MADDPHYNPNQPRVPAANGPGLAQKEFAPTRNRLMTRRSRLSPT